MDADGENPRKLTNNPFRDWDPSWSPDGKSIGFVSDREEDGNMEIYVINVDGGNPRKLTNNPFDDMNPAWYDPAFAVYPRWQKVYNVGMAQTGRPITAIIEKTVFKNKKPICEQRRDIRCNQGTISHI